MTDFLPGAETVDNEHSLGGSYVDGVPWRFVVHTVEGEPSSIAGARSIAAAHEFPPHLWGWPGRDWLGQTVLLSRSAFALLHPAGTPETNKMRPVQIELFGRAAQTHTWPDEWWDWIGERVVAPLHRLGYVFDLDNLAPVAGAEGYGSNGAVRLTDAQWRAFDGICGHSAVPNNQHWDPGRADFGRIATAAKAALTPGDDMSAAAEAQINALHKSLVESRPGLPSLGPRIDADYAGTGSSATGKILAAITAQTAAIQALADAINGSDGGTVVIDYDEVQQRAEAAVREVLGAVDDG